MLELDILEDIPLNRTASFYVDLVKFWGHEMDDPRLAVLVAKDPVAAKPRCRKKPRKSQSKSQS